MTQAPQSQTFPTLLTSFDPPPYEIIGGNSSLPLLLLCDHASNALPRKLGTLGLSDEALHEHIAFDPGAARVTRLLAKRLGVTALFANYSRLLVDCNRAPDNPGLIPEESDGFVVPGNLGLSAADRQARLDEIFWPYQNAVEKALVCLDKRAKTPVTIWSIHSFTPALRATPSPRPWHLGVVWKDDEQGARALLDHLEQTTDLVLGDNEPYSRKTGVAYTLQRHAEGTRPNLLIEIKNSEIRTEDQAALYAERLASFWNGSEQKAATLTL